MSSPRLGPSEPLAASKSASGGGASGHHRELRSQQSPRSTAAEALDAALEEPPPTNFFSGIRIKGKGINDETAAENESEPSAQSSNFTIVTAQRDARLFRGLELDNGMRLVLVSDPKAEVAGASLDVHVGSYSDPDDLPGLAHFCEHMLFLASKKYPEEDGYFEFLRAHGGFANAFTASTHTNYFFGVQPASLEEAMDRLAQFFVSPTFDESQVAREVLAV